MAEEAEGDVSSVNTSPQPVKYMNVFHAIKDAITSLNPEEMREHADRPLRLFLYADSESGYREMEEFLTPAQLSVEKRAEASRLLQRASTPNSPSGTYDLEIYFHDPHSRYPKK